jgi:hypothetical protein
MESIGFKEWAIVCEALGRGDQSIVLRKGGIAEGRDGFSFQHREFFLFPTCFHEQPQKVRDIAVQIPERVGTQIEIKYFAKLELAQTINSWVIAESLAPLHILQPEVVRERFEYDDAPGLHVGFTRIFRVVPVWAFPNEKKYGGCRSWLELPVPPPGLRFEPVLIDAEHARRRVEFLKVVKDRLNSSGTEPAATITAT